MKSHVVQLRELPLNNEDFDLANTAADIARMWQEPFETTVEWGCISEELRADLDALALYMFNTRLPIIILGASDSIKKDIYSRLCHHMFTLL